jgi:hypothetical protein
LAIVARPVLFGWALLLARSAEAVVCPAGTGPSFGAPLALPGGTPQSIVVGDFNADGKLDLAIANYLGTPALVSIRLGTGDGSFGSASYFGVGAGPASLAVADFNADGKPDLATANSLANTVSILLGAGDGSFGAAVDLPVGTTPKSIATGDFNADNKPDLVIGNAGSDDVTVLAGTGLGTFAAAVQFAAGDAPAGLAVGDWNGDAKLDLAIANSSNVSILLGNGSGGFGTPTTATAGFQLAAIAAGDWNGDSKLDLAIVRRFSGLSVLLGDGAGSFTAGGAVSGPASPEALAVADLNSDGDLDIAVVGGGPLYVFWGNGTGDVTTFGASVHSLPVSNRAVAGRDLNGDGRPDLVVGGWGSEPGGLQVFLANCAAVELEILDAFANEGSTGTRNATFSVRLGVRSEHVVTVAYATSDATASAGSDYLPASGTLTFAPGSSFRTFVVQIVGDTLDEETETFLVSLMDPVNASLKDGQATGTIPDDDPPPDLLIDDLRSFEGNGGSTTMLFTVSLSRPSQLPVTVNFATATSGPATATPGADYTPVSGTLTFPSLVTTRTIEVPLIADAVAEPDETFFVSLSGATNAFLFDTTALGTIMNDDCSVVPRSPSVPDGGFETGDPWPNWTVQTSSNYGTPLCDYYTCGTGDGSAPPFEGNNWAWFGGTEAPEEATLGQSVMLPADPTLSIRFRMRIGAVTAPFTDSLLVSVDGTPLATFPEPATPENQYTLRDIPLGAFADGRTHALLWRYSSPGGGSNFTVDNVELATCVLRPRISVDDATAAEGNSGNGLIAFTTRLSAPASQAVTVNFTTQAITAIAGTDYVTTSGTVTFAPGQTLRTILVPIKGDADMEPAETISVKLSTPTNADLGDETAVGTIQNDDAAGSASFVDQYRLYHAGTLEHLYTTDQNEYSVLGTRGWLQEGIAYRIFANSGSYNGTLVVPFYRLYHVPSLQHHWTTDWYEVTVLAALTDWNYEGIIGYVLPSAVSGSTPLYRLVYPNPVIHLWTTDANENLVLSTQRGWIAEGIAGHVVP